MAKIILSSVDSELRDVFNSYDFIQANYDSEFDSFANTSKNELRLNHLPVKGDYLYFCDNYYKQIAVYVSHISYNKSGDMIVFCDKTDLCNIDPYLYTQYWHNGNCISETVTSDIVNCYNKNKNRIKEKYSEELKKYPDYEELRFIARWINEELGLGNNTIIDYMNVIYLIEEVISNKFGFDWHRPNRWEYADM